MITSYFSLNTVSFQMFSDEDVWLAVDTALAVMEAESSDDDEQPSIGHQNLTPTDTPSLHSEQNSSSDDDHVMEDSSSDNQVIIDQETTLKTVDMCRLEDIMRCSLPLEDLARLEKCKQPKPTGIKLSSSLFRVYETSAKECAKRSCTFDFPSSSTEVNNNVAVPNSTDSLPVSPTRSNSRLVRNYLSTSSVKRRKIKATDCHFCFRNKNNKTLGQHLQESETCKALYCRIYRTDDIKTVLVLNFKCLFCQNGSPKVKVHLQKYPSCLRQYISFLQVQDLR